MNHNKTLKAMVAALALGVAVPAHSEDIDLFRVDPGSAPRPNILFMLDNSANWDATLYKIGNVSVTKKHVIHDSLWEIVTDSSLVSDTAPLIRTGIMELSNASSYGGGVVTAHIKDLNSSWSTTLAGRIKLNPTDINSADILVKTNNRPFALTFHEAYLYFKGNVATGAGLGGGYYSYSNVPTSTTPLKLPYIDGFDNNAVTYISSFPYIRYNSPIAQGEACARNIIIFIANGHPDSSEDNVAQARLTALNGVLPSDPIQLTPENDESNWADEYARFMAGYDFSSTQGGMQNVITYVVDVYDPSEIRNDVDRAARAYLQSIAIQGKGQYFAAKNKDELTAALRKILKIVMANDSAFASSALPVSVNVRGTNLNQVYMGVFRPDSDWRPRWMGNLKLYKLALDANKNLYLADANGAPAEDKLNGFILDSAVSHWTQDATLSTDNFWNFAPYAAEDPSESPDGKYVEKGGAANVLRNDVITARKAGDAYSDTRNLYTCSDASCSSLIKFDSSTASTVAALNVGALPTPTPPTAAAVVDWVYGKRNTTEDTATEGVSDYVRASIHGDVLHSRPAVISYSATDADIMAYYGANDGIFRAVRGGTAIDEGHERWGFIPYELLPKLGYLYQSNDTYYPLDIDTHGKPYFMDGSIGVLREPAYGAPTKVNLFVSMRRGGRSLYALDVSALPLATPATPPFSVTWVKNNNSDDSNSDTATSAYAELGYTWSEPKVAKIKTTDTVAYPGGTRTVLIFGGGYDPAFDDVRTDPSNPGSFVTRQSSATMGRDIFVVDAATGAVVWSAASYISATSSGPNQFVKQYPIPSDVSLIDFDRDGVVDRIYVGDTGGNLWRVSIDDQTDVSQWEVKKLASIGSSQKFLYPPDVVKMSSGVYAVLIGSGNRENPNNNGVSITTHHDYFFMFIDDGNNTNIGLADLAAPASCDVAAVTTGKKGWYKQLRDGEKVISSAVTLNGVTYFNTHQMGDSNFDVLNCSSTLGIARVYGVDYKGGDSAFDTCDVALPGGGLPPSPVAVMVKIPEDPTCTGDGCTSQPPCDPATDPSCSDNPTNDELVEAIIIGPTPIKAIGPKIGKRVKNYWFKNFE